MAGCVLITRPLEDAAPLAEALAERGWDSLVAPLLEVRYDTGPDPDLERAIRGAQAVLFTSANGVRAFTSRTQRRDRPVYAVGDATGRAAAAAGFSTVRSAAGDAAALADLIIREAVPARGPLVHVAGTVTAGALAEALSGAGFAVDRRIMYEACTASRLPPAARDALYAGRISHALFFSPRTAGTFVKVVREAELSDHCGRVAALCLSPAVADAVRPVPFAEVRIAGRPELPALLALLDAVPGS